MSGHIIDASDRVKMAYDIQAFNSDTAEIQNSDMCDVEAESFSVALHLMIMSSC